MAIAFDSVGTGANTNFNGVISCTHSVVDNTNGILLAFVTTGVTGDTLNATPKFAGTNMTQVLHVISGVTVVTDLWYLLNPPVGLGTFNGTWASSTSSKTVVTAAYTGVNQSTPINGSVAGTFDSAASGSVVLSIGPTNLFVGGRGINVNLGTTTIGNERGTAIVSTSMETTAADSTGGTLQWTSAASKNYKIAAVELLAAAGGGFTPEANSLTSRGLTGVGV